MKRLIPSLPLIAAALTFPSLALAACPGTLSDCPSLPTNNVQLGGSIINQSGVPLRPPAALPTAIGQVISNTDLAGHTAWQNGGVGHLAILRSADMTALTSQPMTMTVPSGPYLVTAAYATNCNNSPAGAQGNIYRTPTKIASILNGTQTYNSLPYPTSVEQLTLSVAAASLTSPQLYFWLSSGAPTAGTTCDLFVDGIGL